MSRGWNVERAPGVGLTLKIAPGPRASVPDRMSVSVRTLFFAAYRDLLGTSELDVALEGEPTVADLVQTLRARGAPFDALPEHPAVAVNRAYAELSESLSSGDEVAFIPPVAGG